MKKSKKSLRETTGLPRAQPPSSLEQSISTQELFPTEQAASVSPMETKHDTKQKAEVKKSEEIKHPKEKADHIKVFAVFLLGLFLLIFTYYFFVLSDTVFVPGTAVDAETFKSLFTDANTIYILMDVRDVNNELTNQNILQCGVDFAASSGMGGKNVTYLSIGSEGCITATGKRPDKDCFSDLKNGITIYVREGTTTRYYFNGMVVGVGPEYDVGTCGIKRT